MADTYAPSGSFAVHTQPTTKEDMQPSYANEVPLGEQTLYGKFL
jgi:hypothetical protein